MTSITTFEIPYQSRRTNSGTFHLEEYGNLRAAAVISARNEAPTIGTIVKDVLPFVHEVLVMDGHSTDETPGIALNAGAKVIQDPGKGKGSAIRMAIEISTSDILVFIDADGSHDPADIPALVRPVVNGITDLCVGSRFSGGSDELSVTISQLIRTIGNISMNIAINLRWNLKLTDTLNGFRAGRREALVAANLRENRHTIEQEMIMRMLRKGYNVSNIPTHEYARVHGSSHINIWKEWPIFCYCVLKNLF